jgi:hypothetical protein
MDVWRTVVMLRNGTYKDGIPNDGKCANLLEKLKIP